MSAKQIAFVTCRDKPSGSLDDELAAKLIEERGIQVLTPAWDDPAIQWREFDGVIIRSTWDYTEKLSEFLAWIARLELHEVPLWNPSSVLFWNSSKTYLRELEAAGVPVISTAWMIAGETAAMITELKKILASKQLGEGAWDQFVLKPAVSADGRRTHRFPRAILDSGFSAARRAELESALADFDPSNVVMVQPYFEEVASEGEWSFLFFAGQFSHAVLKRVRQGEFRVQHAHGGTMEAAVPPPGGLSAATKALATATGIMQTGLLYARVDMIRRGETWHLGEFEAIEPNLYLALERGAPERFAQAVVEATLHLKK